MLFIYLIYILFAIASKSLFRFLCISIFVLIDSCFYHHTHSVYAFVIWTSVFFFSIFEAFSIINEKNSFISIFRILYRNINVNIIQWMPFYFPSIEKSLFDLHFSLQLLKIQEKMCGLPFAIPLKIDRFKTFLVIRAKLRYLLKKNK